MKIASIFAAAALASVSMAGAPAAASTVTVGSNDGGNCYPFNCNDSGTSVGQSIDYQQIYSSSAFSGAISIKKISFYTFQFGPPPSVLGGDYTITLGTTTAAIGSGYPIGPLSNVQTFHSGSLPSTVSGTYTISGAAYNYNPADGNLVMEVVVNNQDVVPNGSGNGYFEADYTGVDTTRAYLLTGNGDQSGTGALVTTFASVPEPAAWALMIVGIGVAGAGLRRRPIAAHV